MKKGKVLLGYMGDREIALSGRVAVLYEAMSVEEKEELTDWLTTKFCAECPKRDERNGKKA